MKKSDDTARYTAEELATMRRRGESRTDWARFDATTQAELEASITADPDDVHETPQWDQAILGLPSRKEHINIRGCAGVVQTKRPRLSDPYEQRLARFRREPQADAPIMMRVP